VRYYEVKTKDGKVYTATLNWEKEIKTATWESTNREGDHEGVTYVEYKLMDGTNPVSLKVGEVKLIANKDAAGKWIALEPNTDETLWFNKAKETGEYDFFVVTSAGVMYKATLAYTAPATEADFESTGNVGIAPDTAGDAAGKIYAEYKMVAEGKDISLAEGNVEYIKVKVGEDGEWKDLTANTDKTLWFNVEAEQGVRYYEVKTKDGKVYTATLNWEKEIKTATWESTNREGDHEGVTYVEYKLMDGTNPVSLKVGEVKLIANKDAAGKWIALEPNTDETLWFNKAKETGEYDFFVVTSAGVMYKATLAYTAPATEADFESTGNVGIAPDTAGDAAGKIYAEYKMVAEGKDISLAEGNVEYIKVKVGEDGEWKDLTANTDKTLWFNVEAEQGVRYYEVKTKDGKVYTATLNWEKEIKTATWESTNREGDHEGVTYVEYKLMDGTNPVSLKVGEVKLIANKDAAGKWIALEPNTDETLWFNKAKETGEYDFFVVTSAGVMYKATLAYTAPATEADFESTGNVGIAPDTAGDAAGKIYAEYKMVAEGKDISLAEGNVEYIKVKVGEDGEWKDLTANTDKTLWFNVEAEQGVRYYEVKTKDGKVYTATLNWEKEIKTATWESTNREGDHEGVTYVEYKLMDGTNPVSLKVGEVKLIANKDAAGKWIALEPNTDETLWFNKAKETGEYDFFVVTSAGVMYKATLAYTAPATEADFESTGNVGIAPDTAGDAAGKIYAEYKMVAEGKDISLAEGNVEYIKVKVGEDGEWKDLTANTDKTLWFNVEAEQGVRYYEVKTKDGKVYTATLNWEKEIKTATWESTNREGDHEGVTYVEYKLMDGTNPVSLKVGEVKLIANKDAAGKWIALEPNTDETLWFNKAKETGEL
jgi:desulfoferrodoxin (superoxide reductase-like protein)/DNA-binding protein